MKKTRVLLLGSIVLLLGVLISSCRSNIEDDIEANKEAGQEFLKANAQKPGVVVLPSGVQYKVITMGDGARPTASSTVSCHYVGRLIDGRTFDSSIERGKPNSFPISAVIRGWQEVLPMMPVGSEWQIYIPYDYAYGIYSVNIIKPFSTLIFDIKLLAIEGTEKEQSNKKN